MVWIVVYINAYHQEEYLGIYSTESLAREMLEQADADIQRNSSIINEHLDIPITGSYL